MNFIVCEPVFVIWIILSDLSYMLIIFNRHIENRDGNVPRCEADATGVEQGDPKDLVVVFYEGKR